MSVAEIEETGASSAEIAWLVRAMREAGHPIRLDILLLLSERAMSPNGFTLVMRELQGKKAPALGTAAYHFRVLADDGRITLVRETRRRGAIEHFYSLTARGRKSIAVVLDGPERE